MTNMWPYLRLRKQEAAQRRGMYAASFLSRVHKMTIAPRLWASPDHEHQARVAARCALVLPSVGERSLTLVLGSC